MNPLVKTYRHPDDDDDEAEAMASNEADVVSNPLAAFLGSERVDFAPAIMSSVELLARTLPARRRLLGDWLYENDLGFVFAERGVGKTWLGLSIASAIATGRDLGVWRGGERTRVLYIDGEMPLELIQDRLRALEINDDFISLLHHEAVFDQLDTSINLAHEAHRNAIADALVTMKIGCLVLDNLSSLASGIHENDGAEYEVINSWLLGLRRRGITVIFIHHAGRNGKMRGHSKREDAASWILELKSAKTDGDSGAKFSSSFAKPSRNTGEAQEELTWSFNRNNQGIMTVECSSARATEYEEMINHIHEGVQSQSDLVAIMEKSKGCISKWVKRAVQEKRIKRDKQKLFPFDQK